MNDLDKKLLQLLIEESNYISIDELSILLGCSRRTVYNALRRIESYLKENHIEYTLDKKYAKGIFLCVNKNNITIKNNEYDIIIDIFSKNNITLKYLMEKYYLSYEKLSKIIFKINDEIQLYKLNINIKQNIGLELKGKDDDKFLYMRDLLLKVENRYDFFSLLYDDNTNNLAIRLTNIFIDQMQLVNEIREALYVHILYLLSVENPDSNDYIINKNSLYYSFAKESAKIFEQSNSTINKEELIKYFYELYDKINLNKYLDINNFVNIKSLEIINDLKKHFFKIDDPILVEKNNILSLKKHLELTLAKLNKGEDILNPLHDTIKNNYPYYYNEVLYVIDQFNAKNNLKIPPEEAAYIVIYIITLNRTKERKIKGIIVCNYGVGISQYLHSILEDNLDWIEFDNPVDINDFHKNNYNDYIVFSTLDLSISNYIKIPIDLSKLDIDSISTQINKKDYLKLFKSELFYIGKEFTRKDEVIEFLGNKLEKKQYVEFGYKDSIFHREEIASTEVGNGMVLLHGNPSYILKSSISYIKLNNEIFWDSENVNVIILLSILPTEYERYNIKDFFRKLHMIKQLKLFNKINNLEELKSLFYN